MRDLIISLAVDGREPYSQRVVGLERSLTGNWKGDVRVYKSYPSWCTRHSVIPYKFKFDLIQKAVDDGYKRIFWLDSTMRILHGKNISDLLDNSVDGVVAFHNLGHPLKAYINDTAMDNLGITEDQLEGVKQIWGGCIFWDFNKETARSIFAETVEQISLGSFNDDKTNRRTFIAHRHDQAVLSWLLHKNNVELLDYGVIAAKNHLIDKTYIQYSD